MLKKLSVLVVAGFLAVNLCGCVAVMAAGAAQSAEKQNLDIPYSEALDLVKGAFKSLEIQFEKADIRPDIAEVKGKYVDGKIARIYISKISETESQVSVHVGTSQAGREDAKKIIQAIRDYADLTSRKSQ